jgi:glycine dehydrogenase subunit 1
VLPKSADAVNRRLLREGIIGPLPLDSSYPELINNALVCVTEIATRTDIEKFVSELRVAVRERQ